MKVYSEELPDKFWIEVDLSDPELSEEVKNWLISQEVWLRDEVGNMSTRPYSFDDSSALEPEQIEQNITARKSAKELITIKDVGERSLNEAEIKYNHELIERNRSANQAKLQEWELNTVSGKLYALASEKRDQALRAHYGTADVGAPVATQNKDNNIKISSGEDGSFSIRFESELEIDHYALVSLDWKYSFYARSTTKDAWKSGVSSISSVGDEILEAVIAKLLKENFQAL
jgi:hypothetical protein